MSFQKDILAGIPTTIPDYPPDQAVDHAPQRRPNLTRAQQKLAVTNALRYFPTSWHSLLAAEFARELRDNGCIYMRRFRPHYSMFARPIDEYPGQSLQARAIMLMIQNNLDPRVAQFPHELIVYGGNGAAFQNWAQYLLTMKYLSQMNDGQTLALYSGHPMGLFPSHPGAPRVIVTNGMMVPNHSSPQNYDILRALGVTNYGQMTAGSFIYIGPQGIVHGTTITLLGAGRLYLKVGNEGLAGKLFVTSGLGGMSGAQAKAAVIAGAIGVIAEINPAALKKRLSQGWLDEYYETMDALLLRIEQARRERKPVSIGYLGNIVDLWEALAAKGIEVDLGSDQTSLHNPFGGGYYPAGLTLEASRQMLKEQPANFEREVRSSLRRQVAAINRVVADSGMHFWDYGNAFLEQAKLAGAAVYGTDGLPSYPSYVQDIMGPFCFDYGFGPFRWVNTSGSAEDLAISDTIAMEVLQQQLREVPEEISQQIEDNIWWLEQAGRNNLVVGSQARILYADCEGRQRIAVALNRAVQQHRLSGPVVIGRDHHDPGGTDSPWRETANIHDGSNLTADMAVHNFVGDSFRGATWVSLHNGGGTGWGTAINGGFGLVLDGTQAAEQRARNMLSWDVSNGLARRAWAGNAGAGFATKQVMARDPQITITQRSFADPQTVEGAIEEVFGS